MPTPKEQFENLVAHCLDLIRENLKDECKVMLVFRTPGNEEREFVMTDDDGLDEMIEVLRRSKARITQ